MRAHEQGVETVAGCGVQRQRELPTFVSKRGHENTLQPRWSPADSRTGAEAQAVSALKVPSEKDAGYIPLWGLEG